MENYSLLMGAAAVMKMAMEMAAVSMEKPSGGTSLSRRRAGTETHVPQILASRWRWLWMVFRTVAFPSRRLRSGASYRRRGGVSGGLGPPYNRAARPGPGLRQPHVWAPCGSTLATLGCSGSSRDSKMLGVDFVRFGEYFLTRISETKNSRKQELALRHLVNRLVPENA